MKKKLRRQCISCNVILAVALVLVMSIGANAVWFTFDGLQWLDGSQEIKSYMEGIYGSHIEVRNARAADGIFHGPLYDYTGDLYIQNNPSLGVHWFYFSFREVPITSVTLDWGVEFDEFNAWADYDQKLPTSLSDFDLRFFHADYSVCNSGTITYTFDRPVYTLAFKDGFGGEIEIDNLNVTPIPEPATMFLLGSGLLGLAGWGRKRFKKS